MEVTKLVCLGDSITWGFPFGPSCSWVDISAKTLSLPMINRGVNGDTAEDLLFRFGRDVLAYKPSHVFIMAGINDASINIPLESFQDKVLKMHARALCYKIVSLWGLPTPTGDRILEHTLNKYRSWLEKFTHANNCRLLDFSSVMLLPDGTINRECFNDDVHPSKFGYQSMANSFTEFFNTLL